MVKLSNKITKDPDLQILEYVIHLNIHGIERENTMCRVRLGFALLHTKFD